MRFDNFIQSNTWPARRSVLQGKDFEDPKLVVVEDVFLYLLFLGQGNFLFSWKTTANWHWRSTSSDNSMMMDDRYWMESIERVKLRTRYFGLAPDTVERVAVKRLLRLYASNVLKRFTRIRALLHHIRKKI